MCARYVIINPSNSAKAFDVHLAKRPHRPHHRVMPDPIFDAHNIADWRAATERFLKGKPLKTLTRETVGGVARGPLFTAADLPEVLAPTSRTNAPLLDGRPWHILAPVRDSDIAVANAQLLEDLEGGASAARICVGDGEVQLSRPADLSRLLEGVFTDLIPITFSPNPGSLATTRLALDTPCLQAAHVSLGMNPLVTSDLPELPENWNRFALAPRKVHEAGGDVVHELAALAAITAQASRLHGADAVQSSSIVELASEKDAHIGIAKLRAARRITARIFESFGLDHTSVTLHSIGSRRDMQSIDPWSNLLRVMTAGFGAVVGGADAVLTRPFTDGYGRATGVGHRIARNMQLMMMEESHLGQVHDPAFGSYWHESLTDRLAQKAWSLFQTIEAQGGFTCFDFDPLIAKARTARAAAPLIGVNLHPIPDDVPMPEVRT